MSPHDPVLIAFVNDATKAIGEGLGDAASLAAMAVVRALTVATLAGATVALVRELRRLGRPPGAPREGEGGGLRVFHATFASCVLVGLLLGREGDPFAAVATLLSLCAAVALLLVAARGGGRLAARVAAQARARREGATLPRPPRSEPLSSRIGRTLRRLLVPPLASLALLAIVAVAWASLGNAVAGTTCRAEARRAREARLRLAAADDARLAPNETARRVGEKALLLGLDTTPAPHRRPWAVDEGRQIALEPAAEPLRDFVLRRTRRPDDEIPRPPETVRDALFLHRSAVAAVRDVLAGPEPPLWELGPGEGFDAPAAAHLAVLKLGRLLLAEAYEAASQGDTSRVDQALDAMTSLAEGLRARPDRYSQLFATHLLNAVMGLVRKLDAVSPRVAARIGADDLRRGLARAWAREAEAYALFAEAGCPGLLDAGLSPRGVTSVLLRPVARLSLARIARRLRTETPDVTALGFDALAAHARGGRLDLAFPGWDVFGRAAWRHPAVPLRRLVRFELDRDLTRTILRLKAMPPGSFPPDLEGSLPSIATGRSWVYRFRAGRLADVHLDGPWSVPVDDGALALPLRFVGRRAATRGQAR